MSKARSSQTRDKNAAREELLRYHALVDSMNEGLGVADLHSKFTYVNKRLAAMLGYSVPEMIGHDVHEFLDDLNKRILDEQDKKRAKRIPSQYELTWTTKKGRKVPTIVSGAPLIDEKGTRRGSFATITDITERRWAEEAHERSEAKYKALAEGSLQGLVIIQSGRYVYVNRAFANMLGYDPEEILKMTSTKAWSLVHPDDRKRVRMLAAEREAGKDVPSRYSYRFVTRDGSTRWGEAYSSLVDYEDRPALQVLIVDVTDDIEREAALRTSEAKYRTLAEQLNQGLMILSDKGFAYVNRAFADMVGHSVDELMALGINQVWDIIHPEDRDELRKRIEDRSGRRPMPPRYQYRLVRKNGEICWVEAFSSRIEYEGRHAVQTVLIDVTDRVRAEREIKTVKDRATFYLDLMCHDIRNQLQVILNSAALLRTATDDGMRNSFMDVLENSVQRCSRMIEEVRATEQLMTIPLVERSLSVALNGCVQALSARLKEATFETSSTTSDAYVCADEFLELLLSNILVNAVEHNLRPEKHVWVSLRQEGSSYVVSVGDNGPGIPDSVKATLFDLARRFGGMGLHQSNQIIEKYGGKIEVSDRVANEPGMGAEFHIRFPKLPKGSFSGGKVPCEPGVRPS